MGLPNFSRSQASLTYQCYFTAKDTINRTREAITRAGHNAMSDKLQFVAYTNTPKSPAVASAQCFGSTADDKLKLFWYRAEFYQSSGLC